MGPAIPGMIDGDQWERIYLPFDTDSSESFIPDLPA